jgi:hypothetical protein
LAVGVLLRSQSVRFASAAVVTLTVLKVFLIDMHDLPGIYQGLSCSRRSAAVSHTCGFAVASFRSCRGAIVAG